MDDHNMVEKLSVNFTYKDDINRVFDIIKDKKYFVKITKGYLAELTFTKGDNIGEVGTEYTLNWKGVFFRVRVDEVIDTDFYKRIILNVYESMPSNMTFKIKYHFYWNSIERTTLFVKEWIFDYPQPAYLFKHYYEEHLLLSKKLEKYLRRSIKFLEQTESCVINLNINELWKIISDWTKFNIYVPMIAEKVEYFGKSDQVNTKIHIITKDSTNDLKIISFDKGDEYKKTYTLECYNGTPKCPIQELNFTLVRVDSCHTLFIFKHLFKQPIVYADIYDLKVNKQKILNQLIGCKFDSYIL